MKIPCPTVSYLLPSSPGRLVIEEFPDDYRSECNPELSTKGVGMNVGGRWWRRDVRYRIPSTCS